MDDASSISIARLPDGCAALLAAGRAFASGDMSLDALCESLNQIVQ